MTQVHPTWRDLLRRLAWDIADKQERVYYGLWLRAPWPGRWADCMRGKYLTRHVRSAGLDLRVKPGCRFRSLERLAVGTGVRIGYDNFYQAAGSILIGNNVVLSAGVKIWSANHNYNDPSTPIDAQGGSEKPVTIGDGTYVGPNAFILPGATIGRNCVVLAGAVVAGRAVPDGSVIGGNPARRLGARESYSISTDPMSKETPHSLHSDAK